MRILGEGQFRVDDDTAAKLTALDKDLDAAVAKQRTEANAEARQKLVREAQLLLKDGTPVSHDSWFVVTHAGAQKYVRAYKPNSSCLGWFIAGMWRDG